MACLLPKSFGTMDYLHPFSGARAGVRTAAVLAAAGFLALASSCRFDAVAPAGLSTGDVLSTVTPAGRGPAHEREFLGVRISPLGDRVGIAIDFSPGRDPRRHDPDAGDAERACQLLFDTDQDPATGGFSGEECSFYVRGGRVEVRRLQDGAWTLVEAGRANVTPSRIAFDVPRSLLGDDVFVNWTLELFERSGDVWMAVALHTGTNHTIPTPTAHVPTIANLHTEVRQGAIHIQGSLAPRREARSRSIYDPVKPGGWALQVFLDTDESPTGYWLGFDYVVRGVEWTPVSRQFVVRRITLEGEYPGGWGPQSGVAVFRERPRWFEIVVPLEAIGDDDGRLRFAIETYATVECPECESGFSHHWADDYFGACAGGRAPGFAVGSGRIATFSGLRVRPGIDRSAASSRVLAHGAMTLR